MLHFSEEAFTPTLFILKLRGVIAVKVGVFAAIAKNEVWNLRQKFEKFKKGSFFPLLHGFVTHMSKLQLCLFKCVVHLQISQAKN